MCVCKQGTDTCILFEKWEIKPCWPNVLNLVFSNFETTPGAAEGTGVV